MGSCGRLTAVDKRKVSCCCEGQPSLTAPLTHTRGVEVAQQTELHVFTCSVAMSVNSAYELVYDTTCEMLNKLADSLMHSTSNT